MAVFLQLEELVCEKEIDTMGKQKETGKRGLLDCTLRDGGYVNDWNFEHETIGEVFERLELRLAHRSADGNHGQFSRHAHEGHAKNWSW